MGEDLESEPSTTGGTEEHRGNDEGFPVFSAFLVFPVFSVFSVVRDYLSQSLPSTMRLMPSFRRAT